MVETEIYCHVCEMYFRVNFDISKNGNHVVKCPKCQHDHCRVIENGRMTSIRWNQKNESTFRYSASTTSYSVSIHYYTGGSTTTATDNYPGAWTEWRSI